MRRVAAVIGFQSMRIGGNSFNQEFRSQVAVVALRSGIPADLAVRPKKKQIGGSGGSALPVPLVVMPL
jgi:hypothetical protein